jgi:hypothetical protein
VAFKTCSASVFFQKLPQVHKQSPNVVTLGGNLTIAHCSGLAGYDVGNFKVNILMVGKFGNQHFDGRKFGSRHFESRKLGSRHFEGQKFGSRHFEG